MTRTSLQECEQLLLFEAELFSGLTKHQSVCKQNISIPAPKDTTSEYLNSLRCESLTLEKYLSMIGVENLSWNSRSCTAKVSGNRIFIESGNSLNSILVKEVDRKYVGNEHTFTAPLIYFDETGHVWNTKVSFTFDIHIARHSYYNPHSETRGYCLNYHVDEWTLVKRTKLMPDYHFVQSESELKNILSRNNPYTAKWAEENKIDVRCLLMAPHLEILVKAGYSFAKDLCQYNTLNEDRCVIFNRLCQNGSKPKDIFKTTKTVCSVLKNETNFEIWDSYRKLVKLGKIGTDTIQQAYDQRFDSKDLECFNRILGKKYNGKPVFTWNSLMQYLVRLDTFEAISRREAFQLIIDYLSMCNMLQMQPRIDGDSLKREHDIAARNCRNKKDEIMAKAMEMNCEIMKKYNYSEGIYFVRAIKNHEDLLDEANQQHNCVASYGHNIAKGTSYIYVMREVANPEKSLITIELSPNGKTIRQKYLAYNQPIRNKSQSEFIERWMKHNKTIS